jgi:hypothetical protein
VLTDGTELTSVQGVVDTFSMPMLPTPGSELTRDPFRCYFPDSLRSIYSTTCLDRESRFLALLLNEARFWAAVSRTTLV